MRQSWLRIGIGAAALAFAGITYAIPEDNLIRNISASLDTGWYIRVPWGEVEPGAIVLFPIPESVRDVAERGGLLLDMPLMKRIERIEDDGKLIVRGDCGGERSLDSRYFGGLDADEMIGVYTPIPWTTTPCEEESG